MTAGTQICNSGDQLLRRPVTVRCSTRLLVSVCVYAFSVALAADFPVANVTQFNAAIASAVAGDTITLANGTWNNADLVFRGNGTAARPITLRAQVSGEVFLTGSSRLHIAGSHLIAQGLIFTNGYPHALDVIEFQAPSYGRATNCRVTDCAILDFNPPSLSTDAKWVSLYGFSNRVDHCCFQGKRNQGTLMIVWLPPATSLEASIPNYHLIDHNSFGPRPLNGGNGGEILRVGDSATSFNLSRTVVEHNYFNACDGEIEIISNKSCENVYRYNTFVECAGALTLRHGNRCRVEGNYFLGNNKASTGGVRIMGEDHVVMNNYFQDLAGSAGYSALVLMQGLQDSPLNGYFQVKHADLAFNSIINCSNSLIVGLEGTYSQSGTNRPTTLPPLNCTIANNIIFTTKKKLVDQRITPVNLAWAGNIMFGAALGINPVPGILLADPKLGRAPDGLWRPRSDSPALGAAQGGFEFVTDDIRGRVRPPAKDVGSDQADGSSPIRQPLTPADVGPSWTHPLVVALSLAERPNVSLRWASVSGAVYQVQTSAELASWMDAGAPVTASGATQMWEELLAPIPASPPTAKFYRIQRIAGPPSAAYAVTLGLVNRPTVSVQWKIGRAHV